MLICLETECTCSHHKLLDCIKDKANDNATSLLQKLVNPCDLTDSSGLTLLHVAVRYNNEVMTEHLIKIGCKVNVLDNNGFSPLRWAIQMKNNKTVAVLLKNNADIYITDNDGLYSWYVAFCRFIKFWSIFQNVNNQLLIVEMLCEQMGKDFLSDPNTIMQTMLNASDRAQMIVVVFGSIELTRLLLEDGYPVDFQEGLRSFSALHCSIIFAKIEKIKILIEYEADIDIVDKSGKSPLRYYFHSLEAIDHDSEVLKILLQHRAASNVLDKLWKTDLVFLLQNGKKSTVKTILSCDIIEKVKFDSERSILHLLVENKNHDVLSAFDEIDMDLDVDLCGKFRCTALASAVLNGSVTKVKYLLQKGADVNLTSSNGTSALYCAIYQSAVPDTKKQKLYAKITEILLRYNYNDHLIFSSEVTFANENKYLSQVLVPHLALIASYRRSSLIKESCKKIQSDSELKDLFDSYLQQVEAMKSVVVFRAVTLFKLLTVSEEEIVTYARNEEFISSFDRVMANSSQLNSFYLKILRDKIPIAIRRSKLVPKVAPVVETLTGLCSDVYRDIVYKIISYLNMYELQKLSKM